MLSNLQDFEASFEQSLKLEKKLAEFQSSLNHPDEMYFDGSVWKMKVHINPYNFSLVSLMKYLVSKGFDLNLDRKNPYESQFENRKLSVYLSFDSPNTNPEGCHFPMLMADVENSYFVLMDASDGHAENDDDVAKIASNFFKIREMLFEMKQELKA